MYLAFSFFSFSKLFWEQHLQLSGNIIPKFFVNFKKTRQAFPLPFRNACRIFSSYRIWACLPFWEQKNPLVRECPSLSRNWEAALWFPVWHPLSTKTSPHFSGQNCGLFYCFFCLLESVPAVHENRCFIEHTLARIPASLPAGSSAVHKSLKCSGGQYTCSPAAIELPPLTTVSPCAAGSCCTLPLSVRQGCLFCRQ